MSVLINNECYNMRNFTLTHRKDTSGYNIDTQPQMPLVGPASYEEAMERIDAAEQEIDQNVGFDFYEVIAESRVLAKCHEGAFQ